MSTRLDKSLERLFWDCDFERLELPEDEAFVIDRILERGDLPDITWARSSIGESKMRRRLGEQRGRGMDRMRLRFWQLIFDYPAAEVDAWLAHREAAPWERRRAQ